MDIQRVLLERRSHVVAAAATAPLLLCAALGALRGSVPNASAALVLVVLVVAAAATGIRAAGLVAAASSALWFDVLLTEPYGELVITDPADIEIAVLLTAVGVVVTELALWGRRQQATASRTTGYLAGLVDNAAMAIMSPRDPEALGQSVSQRITEVLGIDGCRFVEGMPGEDFGPVLTADATVVNGGRTVNVTRDGLPVDSEIALFVWSAGTVVGQFFLIASTHVARPSPDQLRVAVLLADQVGSALTHRTG